MEELGLLIGLKAWGDLEQQLWAVEQGKGLGIHGGLDIKHGIVWVGKDQSEP